MAPPSENSENSSEKNYRSSIQKAAESHVDEILARRERARATRAAALASHTEPISVKTELTRVRPTEGVTAAAAAPTTVNSAQTAGYLLAVGDSWFDYPIHDVLTRLDDNYGYNIESAAHKGDPIEAMVSHSGQLDKFARCMDKLVAIDATPKAVLISGGGDDIAGAEFGMLVNDINLPNAGWNEQIVAGVIDDRVAAAYRMMFVSIDTLCQKRLGRTFPILVHGYDYPVPDGRGFLGGWGPFPGPWLKPGFDEKLFLDLATTTKMMADLIDRFNSMLQRLVQEPEFGDVHYIDLRGTLSNSSANYKDWWANELHPSGGNVKGSSDGFSAVAAKFQAVLSKLP
jgi:hypothetical protein